MKATVVAFLLFKSKKTHHFSKTVTPSLLDLFLLEMFEILQRTFAFHYSSPILSFFAKKRFGFLGKNPVIEDHYGKIT